MNVQRKHIIELLSKKDCQKFGIYKDHEVWVSPEGVVIRLPKGSLIDLDIVEVIAEQLNMGMWDYDYWLGQIGFNPAKWN